MALIDYPPNWNGVVEKAQKVDKINPGAISNAGKQFSDAAKQAGDHSAALNNSTKSLAGGVWEGPAADSFVEYVTQITKAGDKVQGHLDEVGKDLTQLSSDLGGIKSKVTEAFNTAKTNIDNRIKTESDKAQKTQAAEAAYANDKSDKKGPPPSPTSAKIISDANEANQKDATAAEQTIDPLLKQADDMVKKSQDLMKTQIEGGYSKVPLPNSDGTVPQSTGGLHTGHGGGGGGGGGHHGGGGGGASGGGGGLGPSGGPPSSPPPGNVQQWIQEAIKALQAAGVNVTDADIKNIWAIIQHESGGNPNAINNWDSNAAAGHPSKGLMQCIDSTFNAHKLPGHDNIYNPVDNIIAGVRYSLDRYGSMSNVPGIAAMAHGGAYRGY
ncbi:transglycosylase SLT domain-containing protein [Amycolatopsis sp. FU40]|uniref:transglycosylase SLT domain-containing protein n=1 Tax=Amycolatopsis sp. FU40 TaxID=2914159 RepID=UPI001F32D2B5|nr:transglycosylase SLT domain-containing protein [Amycolatopsis sp. FU40]UKD52992.1 transglycosylase SLT domain-containing protein [Amycolatopsis sp. FU40]